MSHEVEIHWVGWSLQTLEVQVALFITCGNDPNPSKLVRNGTVESHETSTGSTITMNSRVKCPSCGDVVAESVFWRR